MFAGEKIFEAKGEKKKFTGVRPHSITAQGV
jgi:hypothetical protein